MRMRAPYTVPAKMVAMPKLKSATGNDHCLARVPKRALNNSSRIEYPRNFLIAIS